MSRPRITVAAKLALVLCGVAALVTGLAIGVIVLAASAGLAGVVMDAIQSAQGQTTDEVYADIWARLGENSFVLLGIMAALVVVSVTISVLRAAFLLHPMLKAVTRSLSVWGGQEIAELAQSQQAVPGRGEGLADALDVGGLDF